MKIALITDTHFGVRQDSPAFHDYFEKFYKEFFFPYLKHHNIKQILHLGDFWDRRKYVSYYTLQRAKSYFFDQLKEYEIQAAINVGNHDSYYKNTLEINSVDLNFKEYSDYAKPINEPEELIFDGKKILMMPWICDGNFEKSMISLRTTKAKIVFGHFEIEGFEMHKGVFHIGEGLDKTLLSKFDLVASGHFHHKSTVGNINYLGCPYEMSWSDYGDQKGFHIFDTEDNSLTFIPNPFKMFNKIYYDDVDSTLQDIMDVDFEQYSNTQVKVVVKNKENPYWFDKFITALENENPVDIQVVEDSYNFNVEHGDDVVNEAESTLDSLRKYVDNVDLDVDKEQLMLLLSNIYEEAVELQ